MTFLRFLPTAILRNQRITFLLLFAVFVITFIQFHLNGIGENIDKFEDVIEYCNNPIEQHLRDNLSSSFSDFDLVQLQVLIRHGDRAPIDVKALPNIKPVHLSCEFNSTEYSGNPQLLKVVKIDKQKIFQVKDSKKNIIVKQNSICNGGQLTPYGYLQHLILGEVFRNTYKSLLDQINISGDVHVESTDHSRTIQSGASFLTGLFYEELIKNKPKIVVNVHRDRLADGHFLLDEDGNDLPCQALKIKNKQLKESRRFKVFNTNTAPLVGKIASYLGVKSEDMPPFNRIIDTFYTMLCHGQGVPVGPGGKLPQSMVKQALQFSHLFARAHHSGLYALQTLSLLSQMALRYLDYLRSVPGAKRLVLYSAHDTAVAPFLQLLDVWDGKWAPYASNVVVEFYEEKNGKGLLVHDRIKRSYIRLIYNGVVQISTKSLSFCQSPLPKGMFCSVGDLFKFVSNNIYDTSLSHIAQGTFDELLFKRIKALCART